MAVVTREQFEYSIVDSYTDYASNITKRMMLTEVKEHELRKFKLATICVECIRYYFSRYTVNVAPTDDINGLTKVEIENVVQLLNAILETNYWFDFPNDI